VVSYAVLNGGDSDEELGDRNVDEKDDNAARRAKRSTKQAPEKVTDSAWTLFFDLLIFLMRLKSKLSPLQPSFADYEISDDETAGTDEVEQVGRVRSAHMPTRDKSTEKVTPKELIDNFPPQGDSAEEDEDGKLYCLCKSPYEEGVFMVACDNCDDWFHCPCVGITREEVSSRCLLAPITIKMAWRVTVTEHSVSERMASKAFFLCVTFWLFLFLIISFFLQYRLKLLIAIYAQGVGSLAAGRTGLRGTNTTGPSAS
jgi:hypothetical protein